MIKKLLFLFPAVLLAFSSFGQHGVEKTIRRSSEPIPNEYIVILDTPKAEVAANASALATAVGGELLGVLRAGVTGFGIRANPAAITGLLRNPAVLFVQENGYARLSHDDWCYSDPHSFEMECYSDDSHWHLDRIDQGTPVPEHS